MYKSEDLLINGGLSLLKNEQIQQKYIAKNHYLTGSGQVESGGQIFYYSDGIIINVNSMRTYWQIVAYHGTEWINLNSILEQGLLPYNPSECLTFNGEKYGKGVYCSAYQNYAKEYNRGTPKTIPCTNKKVRLVLGLRIRNKSSITFTSDEKIWVIKNPEDVVVQDINLTIEN